MEALKDDRITHGRPQRRDWARDYDPVLPPRLPPADVPKAFQHFGPPAAVHRPGLARATPSLPPIPKDDVFDHMPTTAVTGEGKRKWVDDDGVVVTNGDAGQLDSVKWHAVDDEYAAVPPPKPSAHIHMIFPLRPRWAYLILSQLTEANPFAKKPNGVADGSRNPFGRDNPNNKSLHKSESFFDKAEAAETGKWKGLSAFLVSNVGHKY
jgi:chromosome transmission fidelity protein 4